MFDTVRLLFRCIRESLPGYDESQLQTTIVVDGKWEKQAMNIAASMLFRFYFFTA